MRAINSATGLCYCDTDCLICENADVTIGNKIGEWKIEAELNELWVAGKKMYAGKKANGEWKIASKGVILTPEEIINIVNGTSVKWENKKISQSWAGKKQKIKRTIKKTI